MITVVRNGSTDQPASVSYSIAGGSATQGTDYTGGTGVLSLAAGAISASFNITITNDAIFESGETILLSIGNPVNTTIGGNSTATVIIVNDDAAPAVKFSAASYSICENVSSLTVYVFCNGSTSLPVSINYTVTDGNATAGIDYTHGSGTLSFVQGITMAMFTLNIVNDATPEGNETATLSLSDPCNATIGSPATTKITIIDDDTPTLPAVSISLVPGWNLVSIPLVLQNSSVAAVLPANVRSGLVDIWGWDETAQNWAYYSNDPYDYFYQYYPAITTLETGKAYWIEMSQPAVLTIQGTTPGYAPGSGLVLVPGWNLQGPTGQANSTPASIYLDVVDVWGWDETAQNWVYYSPDSNDYFYQYYPKINTIRPGYGYWIEKACG